MSYCIISPWWQVIGGRSISRRVGTFILIVALSTRGAVCDDASSDLPDKGVAASDDEKTESTVPEGERTTTTAPELVYLTWQRSKNANGKRAINQLWNGKGDVVPFDEAKQAIIGTSSLNVHWWNPDESLRPLVLVYRVDPDFAANVFTTVVDERGRRHRVGTFAPGKLPGWSVSAMAPSRSELTEWPKQISLEIKYPIEKSQLLKTIDKFPDAKVHVADGLEWSVEDNRGLGDRNPAAVLRCEHGQGDWEKHTYDVKCFLRGKKEPLGDGYVARVDDSKTKKSYDLRVSSSIGNRRDIERIEIWRQRNDVRRIEDVPIRLELQPKSDPSEEE